MLRYSAFALGLLVAALGMAPSAFSADPIVFNAAPPVNDLQGSLRAQVQFAQSQIIPARPREGDRQPRLIGHRKTLLLVNPLKNDDRTPMVVVVNGSRNRALGTIKLNPPDKLPLTAYHIDGVPAQGVTFKPKSDAAARARESADLEKLADPDAALLLELLKTNDLLSIDTADGRWVGKIYLPAKGSFSGKVIEVQSAAGYNTTIHYGDRQATLSRGQTLRFEFVGNQWIREGEPETNSLVYTEHAWSAILPAEWIEPGVSFTFQQGSLSGVLRGVAVGAPTELLIHTIDVGMLTSPRGKFDFANDPEAHREYFQTAPVSRLVVSNYEPLSLDEVMLPDGTPLTDFDPSEGGWHTGTMRQSIGKELISLGIDNANYGLNSTPGRGEDSHPYVAAQLAAHNSRGKYANGIQVHGGSGGGGIVTLDSSLGNEFSHEVGHNYGLGHYVDGFKGSVHRSAENINSTWGWDADKNRLIPNFYPEPNGKETCLDNECQPPFNGHSFGLDAMAGGSPFSAFNRFTMYTPNSAAIIQDFLEGKAVFSPASATGFLKWNAKTARMEPYTHTIDVAAKVDAPIDDLSARNMASLLAQNDLVKVSMWDGHWTRDIYLPPASPANRGRAVAFDHNAGYNSTLHVNGGQFTLSRGFKKTLISNGRLWSEGVADGRIARKPNLYGVPVVTLIGYYDPNGELPTHIYPALHGAYGYCYDDDAKTLGPDDCELRVETATGVLRFRLAPTRLADGVMNKFHVNIPESAQPRAVAVIRRGQTLDKKEVKPATGKPTFTINGYVAEARKPATGERPAPGR